MNEFWIWFSTGVKHIADLQGYDHILFVSLLVLTFPPKQPGKLFILITAFTIGHSISLALSVTGTITIHQPLVELLIALSILATAIYNVITINNWQLADKEHKTRNKILKQVQDDSYTQNTEQQTVNSRQFAGTQNTKQETRNPHYATWNKKTPLYGVVLFFGLIHGLGFSYLLRSMLGKDDNVFLPLLYFNTGLEVGQLIIVAIVLLFSLFLALILKWPFKIYKLVFVCIIGLITLKISVERLLDIFQL